MPTRTTDEKCVGPSDKRVHSDKKQEIYMSIFLYHKPLQKIIYPSFLRRRMDGGGDPFYLKFWVNAPRSRPPGIPVREFPGIADPKIPGGN